MPELIYLPAVQPIFDAKHGPQRVALYAELIKETLFLMLDGLMTFDQENVDSDMIADQVEQLLNLLPLIKVTWPTALPGDVSFYSLSVYRLNAYKFFFDMLVNWLLPGKRLNLTLVNGIDFQMRDLSSHLFTLCEMMVHVENEEDLQQMQTNFSIIESELISGIASNYIARRILEMKGLLHDEKMIVIQEYVGELPGRLPSYFDQDVFSEMQHVLLICSEHFKEIRTAKHLSRIIIGQYLFRKWLKASVKEDHNKRYLKLKIFKSDLHVQGNKKNALGVIVGMNFTKEKEVFEKKHILKAIQNYIPEVEAVEDSFFPNRRGTEHVFTLYVEIQKNSGQPFTREEIRLLQQELPDDLKDRIEHLMHPIFMPRNEEEIIRNILVLNKQLKYLRDIPQVIISFDEQTHQHLVFSIILLRVAVSGIESIQKMFHESDTFLEYIHDRCQISGVLRRKHKKETTVFRVRLAKDLYLRMDHSIDLNKARQAVTTELAKIIGEFRDFNGGMISTQNEVLCELRVLLQGVKYSDLVLENFFYSLNPAIMRNILEPKSLFILFSMLLESLDELEAQSCRIFIQEKFVYVVIKTDDRSIREKINREVMKLKIASSRLASSYISVYDTTYKSYIYQSDDLEEQDLFCSTIKQLDGSKVS